MAFFQGDLAETLGTELGEFNIAINGEKKILTKRRANVTHLQVYVNLPMDSEHSNGDSITQPLTQPLMVESNGDGKHKIAIIQQS